MRYWAHQKDKPVDNSVPVDGYGNRLIVGDDVIYNLSGVIAVGTVKEITKWEWVKSKSYEDTWHFESQFKIELARKCEGKNPGHVSTVRRSHSLMLMEDISC